MIKIIKKYQLLFFIHILLLPISIFSQQGETGNWVMYLGLNKVSNTLSIHTEFQYRNHTLASINTEQLLLRLGLNYHFSKKAFVSAGYAFIPSYEFESEQIPPETEEHRIWQQFILVNKLGNVKFEHRYRIEQRWVNKAYKNRFRYRVMLFIPLNKSVIKEKSIFAALYNEVFINSKASFFDRNRLYGALGYQVSKNANIQTGMMYQQVSNYGKWYLQFAFVINTDLRKQNN